MTPALLHVILQVLPSQEFSTYRAQMTFFSAALRVDLSPMAAPLARLPWETSDFLLVVRRRTISSGWVAIINNKMDDDVSSASLGAGNDIPRHMGSIHSCCLDPLENPEDPLLTTCWVERELISWMIKIIQKRRVENNTGTGYFGLVLDFRGYSNAKISHT